jgi:hypothetical protein
LNELSGDGLFTLLVSAHAECCARARQSILALMRNFLSNCREADRQENLGVLCQRH